VAVDTSQVLIRMEDVVKDVRPGFGLRRKRILHGISLEVRDGEIFGFVGPNGSGKTTTMKILMGLIRATSGRATILGNEVGRSAFHAQIGFLPEHPTFYDYLSGREILHFYARLAGVPAARRSERVDMLLDWVGLGDRADTRLRTWSKGMLQRVGIAQALVHDPRVVFLDEPMSGLDPIGRKEIRDLILRLREEGKTVFMNTHILSDMEMLCDRVAIIVAGRIRYEGRIEEYIEPGTHECEVVLEKVSPVLVSLLEGDYRAELRGHGDRVEFRVAEKDLQALLAAAFGEGAVVVSVSPRHVSLEEVFLTAVEDAAREQHEGGRR